MKVFFAFAVSAVVRLVEAVAHPEITPGPSIELLEARQAGVSGAVNGFWSPYMNGSTTAYATQQCEAGEYIEVSSNLWGCCTPGGNACQPPLSCFSGTVYYPTFSVLCTQTSSNPSYTRCGTYYLYSSAGDLNPLTHLYCAAPSDPPAYTLYIQKPQNAVTTTTIAPFQTNPTASASNTGGSGGGGGGSKAPVGAIVGGVIGGLALIAIVAIGIFLLFWRKRKQPVQQQPTPQAPQPQAAGMDPGTGTSPAMSYQPHLSGYYNKGDMAAAGAVPYMAQPGMEHQYQQPYGAPAGMQYGQQPMPQHPGYAQSGSPAPSQGAYPPGGSPGQPAAPGYTSPVHQQGAFGMPAPVEIAGTEVHSASPVGVQGVHGVPSVPSGVQEVSGISSVPSGVQEVQGTPVQPH